MLSRPFIDRNFLPGITWYAVLIVGAIIIGYFLSAREAERQSLSREIILDFLILAIPLGIIFARLYYVFFQFGDFSDDLPSVLFVHEGGLAIYGGILGGLLAARITSRRRNVPLPQLLDLIAPSLALGQAIGRWGNYINMEAYGLRVSEEALQFFPFAVEIPVGQVWYWQMATFFYEFCADLAIFFLLILIRGKLRKKGDVFLWYLLFYSSARTVIEGLRDDSLTFISDFVRISQVLSGVLAVAIVIGFFLRIRDRISFVTVLPVIITGASFLLALLGEFERGAYSTLFKFSQALVLVLMLLQILFIAVFTMDAGAFKWKACLPCLICALFDLGILLYGIGRANQDNTYFVSWRQIAAMTQICAAGYLLYSPLGGPVRKQ